MDTADRQYFDAQFRLIQERLTHIEVQITMLFNAEKKRMADAQGIPVEHVDRVLAPMMAKVKDDLEGMAAALKFRIGPPE